MKTNAYMKNPKGIWSGIILLIFGIALTPYNIINNGILDPITLFFVGLAVAGGVFLKYPDIAGSIVDFLQGANRAQTKIEQTQEGVESGTQVSAGRDINISLPRNSKNETPDIHFKELHIPSKPEVSSNGKISVIARIGLANESPNTLIRNINAYLSPGKEECAYMSLRTTGGTPIKMPNLVKEEGLFKVNATISFNNISLEELLNKDLVVEVEIKNRAEPLRKSTNLSRFKKH